MTVDTPYLHLTIPDNAWDACGSKEYANHPDYEVRDGRLIAQLIVTVGGVRLPMHVEAVPVTMRPSEDGYCTFQEGTDATSSSRLDGLVREFDCCFQTVEITRDGKTGTYAIFAYPHGD